MDPLKLAQVARDQINSADADECVKAAVNALAGAVEQLARHAHHHAPQRPPEGHVDYFPTWERYMR